MEDGYRLIDYGINLNDVIQLMIRAAIAKPQPKEPSQGAGTNNNEKKENKQKKPETTVEECTCDYYEVCILNDFYYVFFFLD